MILAVQLTGDVRDDVHDVAIAFDHELIGDRDGACLRNAADVVAAKVEQHQMFRALFGIGKQRFAKGLVFGFVGAAPRCASDGANSDFAVAHAHQNFRRRANE